MEEARIKNEILVGKDQWNNHLEGEWEACIKIHGHNKFWGTLLFSWLSH
jgi:hypothetical protein